MERGRRGRERERQQVEAHGGQQEGGTERQKERGREAETQREGERKKERQWRNRKDKRTLGTGRQRTRERQRWSETGRRETAKAVADRDGGDRASLSDARQGCQIPWPHVRPRGTSSALTYPSPQHVAVLGIQDTTRPPTSACVSLLGKSCHHVCPVLCVHPSLPISLTACPPSKFWGPCLPLSRGAGAEWGWDGPKRPSVGHHSPQCWLISWRTKPRMSSSWEHQTTEITKHPRIPGSAKGTGCRDHGGSIESGAQGPGGRGVGCRRRGPAHPGPHSLSVRLLPSRHGGQQVLAAPACNGWDQAVTSDLRDTRGQPSP